jgi:GT2 family glycosyltransferase
MDGPPLQTSSRVPLVSVIVPTRDRLAELKRCLASVQESRDARTEVIIVDDASAVPVQSRLSRDIATVKIVRNEERRFLSYSRNAGAAVAKGQYLFFLDDDNVLDRDAISNLVSAFDSSTTVGVSAPVIYHLAEPSKVWTARIVRSRFPGFYTLTTGIPAGLSETFSFHNSFMVDGALFKTMGGFDSANFPMRFSEVDFAYRVRAAGRVAVVAPKAKVWHDIGWALEHVDSARAYYTERNRMILLKRYFSKQQLRFYEICILPFLGSYYLVHHCLSSPNDRLGTAASILRGIVDGLRMKVTPFQRA